MLFQYYKTKLVPIINSTPINTELSKVCSTKITIMYLPPNVPRENFPPAKKKKLKKNKKRPYKLSLFSSSLAPKDGVTIQAF